MSGSLLVGRWVDECAKYRPIFGLSNVWFAAPDFVDEYSKNRLPIVTERQFSTFFNLYRRKSEKKVILFLRILKIDYLCITMLRDMCK